MDAMDSTIDAGMPVDLDGVDLFGDPLSLPTARPPSKELMRRVDEMRSRGCCQTIAWSKQGTIATVAHEGRAIELRYLRCHPKDGSWGMSEPAVYGVFGRDAQTSPKGTGSGQSSAFPGGGGVGNGAGGNLHVGRIKHLAWASTASPELAVIDEFGRVTLLSFSLTLNRPFPLRTWDADPVDDLHAVVGSYWLPLPPQSKAHYVPVFGPAVREREPGPSSAHFGYKYENSYMAALGPFHPNPAKSALLCVTANGLLKVFFSQNNNRIQDTTIELESISSSDEVITHASICSDRRSGGTMYIALALASRQLKIIKGHLQWGLPPADKQMPPQSNPLNPSLKEKRVAYTSWLQNGETGASHLDASMTQLSILQLVPTTLANNHQSWAPPLVFAVRSHVSPYSHELQSIVDVWEILADKPQQLHPAFEQLGSRNGVEPNPAATTRLRRKDPIVLSKVVLAVHALGPGKVICFAFSDGTVQYRDRVTMNEVYTTPDLDRVMTLNQVGFHFGEEAPCTDVAFSPTNCSFAQVLEDGKVKWNCLRYPDVDIGAGLQDAQYAAVVAALTVALSSASNVSTNFDDVLAIARQFSHQPRFVHDWMMEVVRMLKIQVDYSEEAPPDHLIRNANLYLVYGVLSHMGFQGEFKRRSFAGKLAMLTLNVRNILINISIANNAPAPIKDKVTPLDEPEMVDALANCVKWTLDLLSWLSDSLFVLQEDQNFRALLTQAHWKDVLGYLQAKNEVALHLLLCSSTKGFISAACRRLSHLQNLSNKAIQYYENQTSQPDSEARFQNKLYQAYQKMHSHTSSSKIKVTEFDRMLTILSNDIKSAYHTSLLPLMQRQAQKQQQQQQQQQGQGGSGGGGQNKQQQQQGADTAMRRAQAHFENGLLMGGSLPSSFLPVLLKFFGQDLESFKAHTDRAGLFSMDFGILDVAVDDDWSLKDRRSKGKYVDVFKRDEIPLVPGDAAAATRGAGGGTGETTGRPAGQPPATAATAATPGGSGQLAPPRRRCVRCAALMEDVTGHKPGYTFVVAQQRRCSCGGCWGLLLRGSTVG